MATARKTNHFPFTPPGPTTVGESYFASIRIEGKINYLLQPTIVFRRLFIFFIKFNRQNLTLRLLPSDISRTLIEPLILRLGIVGLRLPRLLIGFQVHLMNLLRPGGMLREKKSEQTTREKSASEGWVAITEKIWKLHRYLTPFDTNSDKNLSGL